MNSLSCHHNGLTDFAKIWALICLLIFFISCTRHEAEEANSMEKSLSQEQILSDLHSMTVIYFPPGEKVTPANQSWLISPDDAKEIASKTIGQREITLPNYGKYKVPIKCHLLIGRYYVLTNGLGLTRDIQGSISLNGCYVHGVTGDAVVVEQYQWGYSPTKKQFVRWKGEK